MTNPRVFRTPARILIPKLVQSRDAWKAKADERKQQRKALEIRVRDLEASRDLHRQHAEQLRLRITQLEAELAAATRPALAPIDSPKNSTRHAAGTTTSPSSTSL